MTPERWGEVKNLIRKQFSILNEGGEEDEEKIIKTEFIEFLGSSGKMRVEYVVKPKTLGIKMHVSRRQGAQGREEVIYSDKEVVQYLKVYKWNEGQCLWQEVKADGLTF